MKTIAKGVLMILLLSLVGCATAPTQEELAKADYGTPISQAEAEVKARAVLQQVLHRPDSAQIAFQPIYTGYVREHLFQGGKVRFGYILPAEVNTKNFLGFDTGYLPYMFLFFNGEIVSAYGQVSPRDSTQLRLYER